MITGQVSFVYLIAVVVAWRAARRAEWRSAGAILGVLWTLKPFFGLFGLYLVWTRHWRAVAAGLAGSACSVGLGILVWGPRSFLGWFHDLGVITWADNVRNASIVGLWQRVSTNAGGFAAGLSVSVVLILFVTGIIVRRAESVDRAWLAILTAAIVLSPLGWIYYWWWLVPPAAGVWVKARPASRLARILFVAGCATAWWPWLWEAAPSRVMAGTVGSVYCYGLILLLLSLLDVRTQSECSDCQSAVRQA
jgi:hypothetical protein